jgi:hypothetical protein
VQATSGQRIDAPVHRAAAERLAERRRARPSALRSAVGRHGWTALAAIAIAIVSWPYLSITPGVDADWNGHAFRLIAATAPDGLLLRVPKPADEPGRFAMSLNPSTLTVARSGGNPSGALHYTFVEIPIRSLPPREAAR